MSYWHYCNNYLAKAFGMLQNPLAEANGNEFKIFKNYWLYHKNLFSFQIPDGVLIFIYDLRDAALNS